MRRVLVTGAGTYVGRQLVRFLQRRRDMTVFAVDRVARETPPTEEFRVFDLDRLEFAHYLLDVAPHVVVHLQTTDRTSRLGAERAHAETVVGAQALFGAIGRSPTVRHVIVRSDAAVYGAGPRHPSVLEETFEPRGRLHRYQRDLRDMERQVATMAGTDPDVTFTVLRLAPLLGRGHRNALARYLTLAVVPTILGFDPRIQVLHRDDAVAAFVHALDHPVPGPVNVAAPGRLYLGRILRLGRRPAQPLPKPLHRRALRGLARTGLKIPPHLVDVLQYGRVMETTRMDEVLGFSPRRTCRQTVLATYGRHAPEERDA